MTNPPIYRPDLTAKVVQVAMEADVPVGRGSAPREGGYTQGSHTGPYTDYVVVKAGPATTPAQGEPQRLGRFATSWDARIQVIGHGESEKRCDEAASAVAEKVCTIDGSLTLGGVAWEVQKVVVNSLGATEWSSQEWSWRVTYDVSLHLSREQPR